MSSLRACGDYSPEASGTRRGQSRPAKVIRLSESTRSDPRRALPEGHKRSLRPRCDQVVPRSSNEKGEAPRVRSTHFFRNGAASRDLLLRGIALGAAAVAVLVQWGTIIFGRQGDFQLHWQWARRFLAGEFLYAGGTNLPYPPFWAMVNVPLALLPVRVAYILLFLVGLAALVLALWSLDRLTRRAWPVERAALFWVNAFTILLSSRFLLRDLADGGPNLILLALVWCGIFLWTKGQDAGGGLLLGLAIATKCTPILFLAYFAWKRQWRMALTTALAALVFLAAPMIWQGPGDYARHMRSWVETVWSGVSQENPSVGVLGPEPVLNIALRPALARLLVSKPEDPRPLGLSPRAAGWLIRAASVLLLALVAWRFRGRVLSRGSERVLWECAAVALLALLLSPITWRAHCVTVVPACYLLARSALSGRPQSRGTVSLLCFYVLFALLANRAIVGREFDLILHGWGFLTAALLALLAAVLEGQAATPKTAPNAGEENVR